MLLYRRTCFAGEKRTEEWVNHMPEQADTVLWRYIDLYKFISLVDDGTLYFPRAMELRQSMDPFEGSFTPTEVAARRQRVLTQGKALSVPKGARARIHRLVKKDDQVERPQETYISCWHANPYESGAMWQLYALAGRGVAVKTTLGRLHAAVLAGLDKSKKQRTMEYVAGRLQYIDHATDEFSKAFSLVPLLQQFFHKDRSFRHEEELRLVLWNSPAEPDLRGVAVKIDWGACLDAIVLPPKADFLTEKGVRFIAGKRFGHLVQRSGLEREPLF